MPLRSKATQARAVERRAVHRQEQAGPALYHALKRLYEETDDYIIRNHLGKMHNNLAMQQAGAALQKAGYPPKAASDWPPETVDYITEQMEQTLEAQRFVEQALIALSGRPSDVRQFCRDNDISGAARSENPKHWRKAVAMCALVEFRRLL